MKLFTELPLDEIFKLEKLHDTEINEAKKILAIEATTLCHGRSAAEEAAETARITFEEKALGTALPTITVDKDELANGMNAFELFVLAGLSNSNGEARRLVRGGGGRINDVVRTDEMEIVSMADTNDDGVIKLSAGKKRHVLIRPNKYLVSV